MDRSSEPVKTGKIILYDSTNTLQTSDLTKQKRTKGKSANATFCPLDGGKVPPEILLNAVSAHRSL